MIKAQHFTITAHPRVSWGRASDERPELRKWQYRDDKYFHWDNHALRWNQINDPCIIQALEAELNDIFWEAYGME